MEEVIYLSSEDLKKFRNGEQAQQLDELKEKIIKSMTEAINFEIDQNMLELDYASANLRVPKECIPFRFKLNPNITKFNNYLEKYLILVNWSSKTE